MKKFIFLMIFAVLLAPAGFSEAIIGPELQKALNSDSESFNVIVTFKQDLNGRKMALSSQLRSKKDVFSLMRETCQGDQHFIGQLCSTLEERGAVSNVIKFWLANAMAMQANADAIQELAMQPDVHSISLDQEQQMVSPIEAEEARSLWGLDYIRAKQAQGKGANGEGVVVAVIDTGIDTDHSAFSKGQVLVDKCKSFISYEPTVEDGNGHGTHCAGTVGGHTFGVAPKASLVGVKVLSSSGSGSWTQVMQGVEYAAEFADVLSMSLGGRASANGNVVEKAVRNAIAGGVAVVIAAGNSGSAAKTIGTPGVVEEAITVGAIDSKGKIARFSSRGPTVYGKQKPDVVAPGVGVKSAWKNGGTRTISGTSMATPHVAGLVALYLGKYKEATPLEVKMNLMSNTFGTKKANVYGMGTVDCVKMIQSQRIEVLQRGSNIQLKIKLDTFGGTPITGFPLPVINKNTPTTATASCDFGEITIAIADPNMTNIKTMYEGEMEANRSVPIDTGKLVPVNLYYIVISASDGSVLDDYIYMYLK